MWRKVLILIMFIFLIGALIIMAVKHEDVKTTGQRGYASEWNKNHIIDDGTITTAKINQDADMPMNSHKITTLTDPTASQDAATKKYVDDKISITKGSIGYWSCAGCSFMPYSNAISCHFYNGMFESDADNNSGFASVNGLPNGAIITKVVVYGTFGSSWYFERRAMNGATTDVIAEGTAGVEDTTISFNPIDNNTYSYTLSAWDVDNGESIINARITYTYP